MWGRVGSNATQPGCASVKVHGACVQRHFVLSSPIKISFFPALSRTRCEATAPQLGCGDGAPPAIISLYSDPQPAKLKELCAKLTLLQSTEMRYESQRSPRPGASPAAELAAQQRCPSLQLGTYLYLMSSLHLLLSHRRVLFFSCNIITLLAMGLLDAHHHH